MYTRPSGRKPNERRQTTIQTDVIMHAEGSCLVKCGNTHVLCTATLEESVPPFLRGQRKGWVTAEYGMLPRSTHSRMRREATQGKQSGRTMEIQRLIGRSLRSVVDTTLMGERQITIDCDVIQADGGTRTASITGGYVAMYLAFQRLVKQGLLTHIPINDSVAAVSCGIHHSTPLLDLDYDEDSTADVDSNFVMTGSGKIVEIQGTAEDKPFSEEQLMHMMALAKEGIAELTSIQMQVLGL